MAEGDVVAVVAATPPSEGRDNWHNDASYAAAERVDGLKLFAVERADAAAPPPAFRPIVVTLPPLPVPVDDVLD